MNHTVCSGMPPKVGRRERAQPPRLIHVEPHAGAPSRSGARLVPGQRLDHDMSGLHPEESERFAGVAVDIARLVGGGARGRIERGGQRRGRDGGLRIGRRGENHGGGKQGEGLAHHISFNCPVI